MKRARDHDYMTAGEVAALFDVDPKTISRRARQGRLAHIKTIGGHRRFLRTDIEREYARAQGEAVGEPDEKFPTEPCSTCHKPMIMAVTVKGNRMPIDPIPVERGNIVLERRPGLPLARVVSPPRAGLYVSHFATCPDAGKHRMRGQR